MKSLRWKLVASSLVLVFIPVYLLNRYAILFFDRFTRTSLEQQMRHVAFAVGEDYRSGTRDWDPAASNRFARFVEGMAAETETHIRVISPEGRVLFDSAPGRDADPAPAERPETAEALSGAYSARSRLTADRSYMYYYIARPIKDERRDVMGVVYVVRHTGPIIGAINLMIANQRKATLLALVAAAVTAGFVAWTLTRRLRRLMRAARRTADGAPFDADIGGGDEIGELAGSIREMASSIEERNGYNRDFVSTTIHELRAPLTAIQGAVELLEQGAADNPAARAKFLGNIRHQTERMVRLVGELRELTRLDSELMSSRKEVVSYVPFLRETLERLEQTFEPPRATCRFDPPEDDIRAAIVPGKIEQVLVNLLENAFRYTPADGSVTVEVRCVGGTVETAVRDSGSGIAPANLGRVFDRFFTTERRDRAAEHGSGLGLWIARRIVESHGGAIRAENAQGGGALLTFSLPLA